MNHVNYPVEAPIGCVTEVVRIVREGRIAEEKDALALHLWNVQGYAQRLAFGVPDEGPPLIGCGPEGCELTDEEACSYLTEAAKIQTFGAGVSEESTAIPWGMLVVWAARLALRMFDR